MTGVGGLYAQIPPVACRGGCTDSCWSYCIGPAEQEHVHAATGVRLPLLLVGEPCPALDQAAGRCRMHEARPAICRLFGSAEGMECPYGCAPVLGALSRSDGYRILAAAQDMAVLPPD